MCVRRSSTERERENVWRGSREIKCVCVCVGGECVEMCGAER